MIDLAVAILLAGLTSVWRFYDGTSKGAFRAKSIFHLAFLQTSTPAVLCLIAGLWAAWPLSFASLPLLIPTLTSAYLLVRGMPGWERWDKMLLGFAAPTSLGAILFWLLEGFSFGLILFAASGFLVAATYVLGSKLEDRQSWPFPFTAEVAGRCSYGFMVFGLALL